MIIKKNKARHLAGLEVLIEDNYYSSRYFKVSDFPSSLHSGKNIFRIKGNSQLLEKGHTIQVEVMPDNSTEPIYHEVNQYLDNANRRVVSIYVYPEDLSGLATVTIVGVAKKRPGGRSVPAGWRGRTNVRWQREIYVDPQKENSTPILFAKQPRITVTENVKPYLSESHFEGPSGAATINQITDPCTMTFGEVWPAKPVPGTTANSPFYHIMSSIPLFSASMVGGTITVPDPSPNQTSPPFTATISSFPPFMQNGNINTKDYTASIVEVVNDTKIRVSSQYEFDYYTTTQTGGSSPNQRSATYTVLNTNHGYAWSSTNYNIDYIGSATYTENNYNLNSYANIILANIDPIGGDVHEVKTSMKSHGLQTWDLLSENLIESRELLSDDTNVFKKLRMGDIVNQNTIGDYWAIESRSLDLTLPTFTPELKSDTEVLMSGMIISGSKGLGTSDYRSSDYIKAYCTKPIDVYRGCVYDVSFKCSVYGENDDEAPEAVDNGTFTTTGDWDLDTNWSIGAGVLTAMSCNDTQLAKHPLSPTVQTGGTYRVEFSYTVPSSQDIRVKLYGPNGVHGIGTTHTIVSGDVVVEDITIDQTGGALSNKIAFQPQNGTFTGFIDNLSVKEVPIGPPKMEFYISGSGVDYTDGTVTDTNGKRLDIGELSAPAPPSTKVYQQVINQSLVSTLWLNSSTVSPTPVTGIIPDFSDNSYLLFSKDYAAYSFTADNDGQIVPVFKVRYGKWVVSDISIRPSTQTGFTPNHTIIEARVPEYQHDDILDFKFEFYNPQGLRSDLVFVTESISFEGGNTYITAEGYLGEGIIFDGRLT